MALTLEISMSLDGFVAGPNPSLEDPLGKRGEELHEWAFGAQAWREAHGDDGRSLIVEVARLIERHRYPTRIIAAAIRNARQLSEAALAGAHCATTGFSVYADSFKNPYTDLGNQIFGTAWDATATGLDR